jgi:hypothetical protein
LREHRPSGSLLLSVGRECFLPNLPPPSSHTSNAPTFRLTSPFACAFLSSEKLSPSRKNSIAAAR